MTLRTTTRGTRSVLGILPTTLLLVLTLGACGDDDSSSDDGSGDDNATFEDDRYPFTFEYPEDFESSDDVSFDVEAGGSLEDVVALGHDEENALIVSRTQLNIEINDENLDVAKQEFDTLHQQIDPESEAGKKGEYGGYPALEYEISLESPPEGVSRIIAFFDGDQQYTINCQSTPDGRDEIDEACQLALDTLT